MALTPKENYLGLYKGQLPEWIPSWGMGMPMDRAPVLGMFVNVSKNGGFPRSPDPDTPFRMPEEWTNDWGVTMVSNPEANYGGLPKPGHFILDDIRNWDKVIKKPEMIMPTIDEIDWEAMAKEQTAHIDRSTTGVMVTIGNGVFQFIVGFMGFEEALIALVEEPEVCKEFFAWADDYYVPIAKKAVEYYKPDMCYMADDSAAKYAPFVSPKTYREVLKPSYARAAAFATERDIPIAFHNCGKAEAYLADMHDFGVKYWDPCQTENDLLNCKAMFDDIVICGGFDFVPPADGSEITEEFTREYVRSTIDKLAPGGRYAWMGMYMGPAGDEVAPKINEWIRDEVYTYGDKYYEKH
ncbi:MAG: hypothetical protein FWG30_03270 [Eubacteriaceae bacterium]|nr:hypothetical protein [Eubacteriaceae bacterium]